MRGREKNRVRDPLTGMHRPISGVRDCGTAVNLRHDLAGSSIARGAYFNVDHDTSNYYLTEVNRNREGPYFGLFVEHKNLAGLKVTLDAFNITDSRNHFDRVVHSGRRIVAPVVFNEHQNQRVSQIFSRTVTGSF